MSIRINSGWVRVRSCFRFAGIGGVMVAGAALLLIAAAPVVNQTVAIVDPNAPTQQAGVDTGGNLKVNCISGCSAGSGTGADNADGVAAVSTGLGQSVGYGYLYNGATWDRQTGSASRGADLNLKDVAGAAVNTGHGTAAGSLRVELPSDGTGVVGLAAGANIVGKAGIDQTTPGTTNGVTIAPSAASGVGQTPVATGAAGSSQVLKASAGNLYGVYATNLTGTAGFLVVLNATSAPADGAIAPLACVPLTANGVASINFLPGPPAVYSTGIVAVVTSASTCFTKTTSGGLTAFIAGQVS